MDHKMDSEILEEASPTESMPSSTDEWDRGTTYEYSPKKSKFPKYVFISLPAPQPLPPTSKREGERYPKKKEKKKETVELNLTKTASVGALYRPDQQQRS